MNTVATDEVSPQPDKHFEINGRSPAGSPPTKVHFTLSKNDAIEILRLSALVKANNLTKAEKSGYKASWQAANSLGGKGVSWSEQGARASTLNVSATGFWFSTHLSDGSGEVQSETQDLSDLAQCFDLQANQAALAPKQPRVLIIVSGGIADYVSDEGIDVEIFDWDDYNDDPSEYGGVPAHFADLAEPSNVPVDGEGEDDSDADENDIDFERP